MAFVLVAAFLFLLVVFQVFLISGILKNPDLVLYAKGYRACATCGMLTDRLRLGPLQDANSGQVKLHCSGCLSGHLTWNVLAELLTSEQYRIVEVAMEDRIESWGKHCREQLHSTIEADEHNCHNRGVAGHSGFSSRSG